MEHKPANLRILTTAPKTPEGMITFSEWETLRQAIDEEPLMTANFKAFCDLLYDFDVPIFSPGGSEIRRLLQILTIPLKTMASQKGLIALSEDERGKTVIRKFVDYAEAQRQSEKKSKKVSRYPCTISRDEAKDAIYIDFEGGIDTPPSLVGVLVDGLYTAIVLNPAFESLSRSKSLKFQSLEQFTVDTLARAHQENRCIVAWSEHEWDIMHEFDDGTLGIQYRNANLLVKEFFKKNRRWTLKKMKQSIEEERAKGKWRNNKIGLKDYLALDYVGYKYPPDLQSFGPSTAITGMEKQLKAKDGNYAKVSAGAKRTFTNLIRYNKHDCKGAAFMIDYIIARGGQRDSDRGE